MIKGRPPRLERIFQTYDSPLFFVTFCTLHRLKIDQLNLAHDVFTKYAFCARDEFKIAVGRYVIIPDHVHLFVQGDAKFPLESWVGGLKRAVSVSLGRATAMPLWQPGFFDHPLRNDESYAAKWNYVHENPVRQGLVTRAEDWLIKARLF